MIDTRMLNAKRLVQVKHVAAECMHFLIVTLDRILRRGDERLRDHKVLLPRELSATDLWSGGRRGQRIVHHSAHPLPINTRRCEMVKQDAAQGRSRCCTKTITCLSTALRVGPIFGWIIPSNQILDHREGQASP
jgi:hypothetical protein